jgi:hypothetical protein
MKALESSAPNSFTPMWLALQQLVKADTEASTYKFSQHSLQGTCRLSLTCNHYFKASLLPFVSAVNDRLVCFVIIWHRTDSQIFPS